MRQLELFHGEHLAIAKCRAALARGDVRGAREALGDAPLRTPEARDIRRLAELEKSFARLEEWGAAEPKDLHAAFEAVLGEPNGQIAGRLEPHDWFRLYALGLSRTLEAAPAERFRGWCAVHFALAGGQEREALRLAEHLTSACHEGWAWLEAARAAVAADEGSRARRWLLVACLTATGSLDPEPPPIAPTRVATLNPSPEALPRLPRELEDLWAEAEELRLPEPVSCWVPVLGVLDGILSPSILRVPEVLEAMGFDPYGSCPAAEPPPRAFLRALLAARQARERDPATRRGWCGEQELGERVKMRKLSPVLLDRYLARVGML